MKKSYHICISSDDEVMFRDNDDYNRGFNTLALALHKTDSTGLVESIMSTHIHMLVQTNDPRKLAETYRMPYAKYFNYKYDRVGRLGNKGCFILEVQGLYHHLAAMSYILRNGLHHGVAPIPYAYPHSSVNVIFQKEMGKRPETDLIPTSSYYRHIGRNASFPDSYKMSSSGLFLRESVLDIAQVENMFVTPRTFDYYMGRKTSEDWIKEQNKDHIYSKPITLDIIESNVQLTSLEDMLILESGRSDYRRLSDIDLCREIDTIIKNELHGTSVYTISYEDKMNLFNRLRRQLHIGETQLSRCLAMKYKP